MKRNKLSSRDMPSLAKPNVPLVTAVLITVTWLAMCKVSDIIMSRKNVAADQEA